MIRPFSLHRPASVREAVELAQALPDASFYRGGTELLQVMKLGFARFEHLIDLKSIRELHGVSRGEDGWIRIGAGTTHHDIASSDIVTGSYPTFAALEGRLANPRVRNVGSLGGNLCFAEPHSDPAPFLLAIEARLELVGPSGQRTLSVEDFILDALTTDLRPAELLTAILIPPAGGDGDEAVAYERRAFVERPSASVTCRLRSEGGRVSDARIAIGAVADRPALAGAASTMLRGVRLDELEEATRSFPDGLDPSLRYEDDPTISADYKRHLATVLTRRAVVAAAEARHAG